MRILRENRDDGCNIKISANQQKKMKELEEAEKNNVENYKGFYIMTQLLFLQSLFLIIWI